MQVKGYPGSCTALHRSTFGLPISCASQIEPFDNSFNNILVYIAQYAVLLTYGAALAIETGLSGNLGQHGNDLIFGVALVAVNLVVLGVSLGMGYFRHQRAVQEERAKTAWRHKLSPAEEAIIQAVMGFGHASEVTTQLWQALRVNAGAYWRVRTLWFLRPSLRPLAP